MPTQQEGAGSMEDEQVDIDKVQSVYLGTVAAFGKESTRAKDLSTELEGLRAARQQAKPLSLQLRAAERGPDAGEAVLAQVGLDAGAVVRLEPRRRDLRDDRHRRPRGK